MLIYDTLSGKKKFIKAEKRPLKLFVCGPTVYDLSHIGHARTYLAFDIFTRYLRHCGFKIFYLQNITDIDDRIIKRAKESKKNPFALAKFFEKEYHKDMKRLDVNSVNRYARATDFIPQIVRQIKTLIQKDYAYKIPNEGCYFDIAKFPDYGKLSKRTVIQAEDAVSRIDESKNKRNKGDFALWKFQKNQHEPAWAAELGKGRPGWHIEDTAITEKFFGPQYDIHGGGVDLKFPHHEAEIAEAEAASGKKPFVKIWMHTGFLLVNGKKMSKSLKNFITIRAFLKKYPPEVLRWIILSHHYRSPINFSWELAEQAKASLDKINEFLLKLDFAKKIKSRKTKKLAIAKILPKRRNEFHKAMEDDLNTPLALARLFELTLEFQKKIWTLENRETELLKNYIDGALKTLGIKFKPAKMPRKIKDLVEKRELLRTNKQFIQADALRKKILVLGYSVEDTPLGPFVKPAA